MLEFTALSLRLSIGETRFIATLSGGQVIGWGVSPVITHKDGEPTTLTEANFQEEHEPIELHAPDD